VIELINVSKWYSSFAAVRNVSLSVEKGELVLLRGDNGAGKSTLLRLIAGVEKSDEGEVLINSHSVSSSKGFQLIKKEIGIAYLCADSLLYADLQIGESLRLIGSLRGANNEQYLKFSKSLGIGNALEFRPSECSQGMLKKASFVASILGSPKLILLDEPFSSLDAKSTEACLEIVYSLSATGATVLIASHEKDFKQLSFDGTLLLEKGRLK